MSATDNLPDCSNLVASCIRLAASRPGRLVAEFKKATDYLCYRTLAGLGRRINHCLCRHLRGTGYHVVVVVGKQHQVTAAG